ncbi:Cytochrome oxidase assembly protein ShyY1 [Tessaracoccus bendigoensis DSM 12906]|uniref:SURF1-like protein n=1 Tax=Tessaracoccus bendigoensis DSM 12906 TaxID=1123357 RepID=A0A1M6IBW1_9ACTN|nr:SURF1 family protein [Tessaracoccus bendigoensis]SHJ31931.1 Cytochrome oxidase assembly protein ShyY1 [Tessaracoccus bendigoensis DSM 12906]
MNRQVRRWIAMGVLVVILVITFIQLGEWQLRRLDERRDSNATVQAHEALPVQPYQEVMNREIDEADQWYRVTATGSYTGAQFQVLYRSLDGSYGSEVVAVLATDQGQNLLVNRGFLTRQPGHPDGEMPATLEGTVTVTGYVRRNDGDDENAATPHENQVRLINSDAIGKALGEEVVNGYVSLIESTPSDPGGLTPLHSPNLEDEGPHLSYAFQWFAFTAIAVIGLGVLIRADVRDRRKAKAVAERADAAREGAARGEAAPKDVARDGVGEESEGVREEAR